MDDTSTEKRSGNGFVSQPRLTAVATNWCEDSVRGLAFYYCCSLVVFASISFGAEYVVPLSKPDISIQRSGIFNASIRFDGLRYREIALNGYQYDPSLPSSVAFFPIYPLLSRLLATCTGMHIDTSLLIVSNVSLAISFVLLTRYLRARAPELLTGQVECSLLMLGLFPTSLFFRVAYSESLFLMVSIIVMYGIVRRWSVFWLAVWAGLATGIRPVGIAVTASVLWHAWSSSIPGLDRFRRLSVGVLLGCWGLVAFMTFQYCEFGDPLAFVHTQSYYVFQAPNLQSASVPKAVALATLEPVRGVFDEKSPRYWGRVDHNMLFSLTFWNPIVFVGSCVLLVVGIFKKWLSGPEVVLGVLLLAVPYVTRACEMSMMSFGRFAAVVVTSYIVGGRIAARMSPYIVAICSFLAATILAFWTALYSANYLFF